jgi:hypothetical protein
MMYWARSDGVDEKCIHILMRKLLGKRSVGWRHDCNIDTKHEEVNFDAR